MSGKLVYRDKDAWGELQVVDDGERRLLNFGTDTEQSCILRHDPARLQYEYTRAMLLPLLYAPTPRRALLLGLGAGSLATCLHRHCREMKISAVELRPAVIDVAYRYFGLPQGKKLQVFADDALHWLHQQPASKAQLILSDLYGASDADPAQLNGDFLQLCQKHLHNEGWLVINCWQSHRRLPEWREALQQQFGFLAECTTQAGNWVIFARRTTPSDSNNQLKSRQREWLQKTSLNLPLSRLQIWQA